MFTDLDLWPPYEFQPLAIYNTALGVLGLTISEFRGHRDDSGHLTVRV